MCGSEAQAILRQRSSLMLTGNSLSTLDRWSSLVGCIVGCRISNRTVAGIEYIIILMHVVGLANFGASFRVPGIVTIGPNLRVLAQLSGDASLHM